MPAPESSPLRALDFLYDRLAADARYDLARPGYSAQKVSFCILLNPDGALSAIQDERDMSGKRPLTRLLTLPGQAKPSGQGLNPCFLVKLMEIRCSSSFTSNTAKGEIKTCLPVSQLPVSATRYRIVQCRSSK